MSDLGDIAAKIGLHVFPCSADKKPCVSGGFKSASNDRAEIKRMFSAPSAALIAIPTGEITGIVVIDVDIKAGAPGMAWLNENADALPQTRTHKTRSGGLHLLFRYPAGVEIRNSASRIAPGIDVRGSGGYIIYPPSAGYQVADPTDPAEMPLWLIRACSRPEPPPATPAARHEPITDGGTRYGLAALEGELEEVRRAAFGSQESTLNEAALKLGALAAGGQISESAARQALIAAGNAMPNAAGERPWTAREIEEKVIRGMRDGATRPRAPKERILAYHAASGGPPERELDSEPVGSDAIEPEIPWGTDYSNIGPEPHRSIFNPEGIQPLGHDRGIFYYLSLSAQQVFALSADKHSKNAMLAMASLPHYWQNTPYVSSKGAMRWDEAVDSLMRSCREVGIYNPDTIRGRGAWLDKGRPILHLGNRIIFDGAEHSLNFPNSNHVYECAKPLSVIDAPPLSNQEAHCLVKICSLLRWDKPVYGKLLAGWITLAPICGALAWRPAVWITGGPGSGKSWLKEKIISASLGNLALAVQSKTSEAGIRQSLGSDARPVLFDEAEREDQHSAQRMQAVLDLVRQSSSEGGAEIVKGTGNQSGAKRYRIRSMFAFQSINVSLLHQADSDRVTVLTLREPRAADADDQQRFADLEITVAERITEQFSAGLIARSVSLIPTIRANAETFARAIAAGLGSRRLGDQIGTLLAGAYSLHSTGLISPEQAAEFVARDEWADQTPESGDKDEARLLRTILAHRLKLGVNEMPVSRLLEAARGSEQQDGLPTPELAQRALSEAGIKFAYRDNKPGVYISTNHPALRTALRGTPWDVGWSRALLRIEGTEPSGSVVRFGLGAISKATWLPMHVIDPFEDML